MNTPKTKTLTMRQIEAKNEADIIMLDKCQFLLQCIESSRVHPEATLPGSDQKFQLSFDEGEIYKLKGKLFELIKSF